MQNATLSYIGSMYIREFQLRLANVSEVLLYHLMIHREYVTLTLFSFQMHPVQMSLSLNSYPPRSVDNVWMNQLHLVPLIPRLSETVIQISRLSKVSEKGKYWCIPKSDLIEGLFGLLHFFFNSATH